MGHCTGAASACPAGVAGCHTELALDWTGSLCGRLSGPLRSCSHYAHHAAPCAARVHCLAQCALLGTVCTASRTGLSRCTQRADVSKARQASAAVCAPDHMHCLTAAHGLYQLPKGCWSGRLWWAGSSWAMGHRQVSTASWPLGLERTCGGVAEVRQGAICRMYGDTAISVVTHQVAAVDDSLAPACNQRPLHGHGHYGSGRSIIRVGSVHADWQ